MTGVGAGGAGGHARPAAARAGPTSARAARGGARVEEGADESVALQEALAIIRQISADAERLVRKELKAK